MNFQEQNIQCLDCGAAFAFSIVEQEYYASRGSTNVPRLCPSCRGLRKIQSDEKNASIGIDHREMYPAVCTECGKDTRLPFRPRAGRRVYCSDCYDKVKVSR